MQQRRGLLADCGADAGVPGDADDGAWTEPPGWEQPERITAEEELEAPPQPEADESRLTAERELGIDEDVEWVMSQLNAGEKPLIKRCFFNGA